MILCFASASIKAHHIYISSDHDDPFRSHVRWGIIFATNTHLNVVAIPRYICRFYVWVQYLSFLNLYQIVVVSLVWMRRSIYISYQPDQCCTRCDFFNIHNSAAVAHHHSTLELESFFLYLITFRYVSRWFVGCHSHIPLVHVYEHWHRTASEEFIIRIMRKALETYIQRMDSVGRLPRKCTARWTKVSQYNNFAWYIV